jgi:general secretion pathway protein G
MLKDKKIEAGFTLIELLVVMFIIGILATLLMSNLAGFRERARDARRKSDLRQIESSLALYYSIYREYPASSEGKIIGCNEPPVACDWGNRWSRGENVLMKQLPQDPLYDPTVEGSPTYYYEKTDTESFYLKATLENASDKDITSSQARCGKGTGTEYIICQD